MMNEDINSGFNFDNSYTKLPKIFYSNIKLNPVPNPQLIIFNDSLAKSLGLNLEFIKSKEGINILAGNEKLENGAYIAQAYAGHQFGYFTMLGDGRALLIGEQITNQGERFDIQLKGSGITPYSRRGDGRAVLGPMLREYIISEAMHGLRIPTTRSLAVVKTGEKVFRECAKEGAVLTRVASSHIRVGTFEYAARFNGKEEVKLLADYCIKRHFPYIEDNEYKYVNLLNEVIKLQGKLIAKWQSVGFIHGVMNTDNITICGETIDYGPCAFMDTYDKNTVFSSIDTQGRYAYKNQPVMAHWGLCRFAEALIPILNEDYDEAIKLAQESVDKFTKIYNSNWISQMKSKLGIFNEESDDVELVNRLLNLMEKYKEDFTITFVNLTFNKIENKGMYASDEFSKWHKDWQDRLTRQSESKEEVVNLMKNSNPAVIPRNHRVEEALEYAENGDYSYMKNLLEMISNPYKHSKEQEEYAKKLNPSVHPYRTYCGT